MVGTNFFIFFQNYYSKLGFLKYPSVRSIAFVSYLAELLRESFSAVQNRMVYNAAAGSLLFLLSLLDGFPLSLLDGFSPFFFFAMG